MDITENKTEIMTDLYGDKTPQDFQDMGMMARVIVPLIAYDTAVFQSIVGRGDRTTWGQINTPGIPLAQSGYGFPLYITAPLTPASAGASLTGQPVVPSYTAASPWYFYKALTRAEGQRLATKANPFRLEFVCWPWVGYTATTAKNAPLFTRGIV